MYVQYHGVCSTVGAFSNVGDIMIDVAYLEYHGGCSVPWRVL